MKLVTRSQWGARAPKSRTNIVAPVKGVAIHWIGPKQGTWTHDKCAAKVKGIQSYHMDKNGWSDIAYSHLCCPHGYIFEGRKWGTRTAANGTNTGNAHYHAICYMGGTGDDFTPEAKAAIREYVAEHKTLYGDEVRPHSFFKATECPGSVIRDWIAKGMPAAGGWTPTPNPAPGTCDEQVFKVGSKGDCVKEIQRLVGGIAVDGDFGPNTESAVKAFQTRRGLVSDGIVGPNTWKALRAGEPQPEPKPEPQPEPKPEPPKKPFLKVAVTAETSVDRLMAYMLAKRWDYKFVLNTNLDKFDIGYIIAIGKNAQLYAEKGQNGGAMIVGSDRYATADAVLELIVGPEPDDDTPWT